ncbi:hypothetical protein [Burkholderia cenocepacia]|uniref:hypothetical protein n=1 Tax=Burkholderia cenocepacia TaxID=95486 RepID=UPI0013DEE53C|nr:hypothetical protein [Burkholderia cenocepacia]MCW3583867.1 hypothetical protein [Burkholderia cenocepacia]MCW3629314.1 hypothetical protein [Burkholderia cenocepacia]MCW5181872.1 hypothetical protein [Burkholderia cenocepacia]
MTTSHNAGYRRMIGYIQPSAVERLDLGMPETIFPVRSTSGTIPVYIDPIASPVDKADEHAIALQIVHREAGRTLSRSDFELCLRIAKRALNVASARHDQAESDAAVFSEMEERDAQILSEMSNASPRLPRNATPDTQPERAPWQSCLRRGLRRVRSVFRAQDGSE